MPPHERPIKQIQYSFKKEIDELYWSISIQSFSIGLMGIFFPIYLFQYFNRSIIVVFIFFLFLYLSQALLVPLTAKLLNKLGLKKMMAIGLFFMAFYLLFLTLAKFWGLKFIILSLIFASFYLIFYWPARHIDFAQFIQEDKTGKQIGLAQIFVSIFRAISPFIGGLIIVFLGFPALFTISIILLLSSSIPLFFSPEIYRYYQLSWKNSFKKIFQKNNQRSSAAFFFEGIESNSGLNLFPIFIFIVIGKIETIGWVTSLSLLLVLFFIYFIGWLSDKKGDSLTISWASVMHAFSWLINTFIKTPFQFLIYSTFFQLATTANQLPFTSLYYKRAKQQGSNIAEYIVFREITHALGRVFMSLVIIIGFSQGLNSFFFYFALAGLSAFLYRLIYKPKKRYKDYLEECIFNLKYKIRNIFHF